MMDSGWDEVERMAQAASAQDAQIAAERPSAENIARWSRLFGYSNVEAMQLITHQRADVTRERITDEHWALVKDEKEAVGYDREAYEHSLHLPSVFKENSATIPTTGEGGETILLFRLGGLLESPEKVQQIAQLEKLPKVVQGMSENGVASFCLVNRDIQKKLEEWLAQQAVLHK